MMMRYSFFSFRTRGIGVFRWFWGLFCLRFSVVVFFCVDGWRGGCGLVSRGAYIRGGLEGGR